MTIVEEPNWLAVPSFAEHGALKELDKLTEQIEKHVASALNRAADAAKQAGVPFDTIQVKDAQPYKASFGRPRRKVAISS